MNAATVSLQAQELEAAVLVLRDAARDIASRAAEVPQRIPIMTPTLEAELFVELQATRMEMELLALEVDVEVAQQGLHLAAFLCADGAEVASHDAGVIAAGVAALPAAVAHDAPDGQRNFQVNFQDAAAGALAPFARPDYLTYGIGFGPIVGVQASLSYSRSGHVYLSPGVNIGTPGAALFDGAGHVNTPREATGDEVDSYLDGTFVSAGGFVGVGGTAVSSPTARPGARSGYESGFGTPQAQLAVSQGFRIPFIKGPSW